jgi:tetratricopeptide (TPR) repeat protein
LPLLAPPVLPAGPPKASVLNTAASRPSNQAPPTDNCNARAAAYVKKAYGLLNRNDFHVGLEFCDLALKADPNCGQAYLLKGYTLFKLENPEQSVQCLKHGLSLLPAKGEGLAVLPGHGPEWSYHILVAALIDLGHFKEALESLDRAPASFQKNLVFLEDRGILYVQLRQYEKSIDLFSQIIKANPSNNYYYRERARAYLLAKKPAQAVVDFTTAIKREPTESSVYSGRAEAYKQLGKMDLARADYAKANEVAKNNTYSPLLEPISK